MTELTEKRLARIQDLKDAIWMVSKNANTTETECIQTLAELIGEEIEKIQEEEGGNNDTKPSSLAAIANGAW